MKKIENFTPKKILVLQQRQLGDVVVATPVFSVLKKAFPNAYLALFTEEKCYPLVQNDPNIDGFHIIRKKGFFEALKLYWNIFRGRYDLVVSMQQLGRCQLATLFSMAKVRLSFYPRHKYREFIFNIWVNENELNGYVADNRQHILTPLGIEPSFEKTELYITKEEKEEGREFLNTLGILPHHKFITLDATHKHERNRWRHYKELVELILTDYPDYFIFLFRAPGEEEQLQDILNINSHKIIMPKVAPSIRLSLACLSYASFHIGNTSAPAHMATALNIPVLVVLARTQEQWHCQPKWQYQGRARQLEVRPKEDAYANYLKELEILNKTENCRILPDLHAPLNVIKASEVIKVFDELVRQPFY